MFIKNAIDWSVFYIFTTRKHIYNNTIFRISKGNDEDNELEPKRSRKLPLTKLLTRANRNRRLPALTRSTTPLPSPSVQSTVSSRILRSFPTRRSITRSTAAPSSTTPLARDSKSEGSFSRRNTASRGSYRKKLSHERLVVEDVVDPIQLSTKVSAINNEQFQL